MIASALWLWLATAIGQGSNHLAIILGMKDLGVVNATARTGMMIRFIVLYVLLQMFCRCS
jgi:hypothetical protein